MKINKMFQGLTLMVKEHPNEFVWATVEEIPKYIALGYVIVNDVKRAVWDKQHGGNSMKKA